MLCRLRAPRDLSCPALFGLIGACLCLLAAESATAQVQYGDFFGTNADFEDVTETTLSASDPVLLFGPPIISGDQLEFSPSSFSSSCTTGNTDTTSSQLTTTIRAKGAATLGTVTLGESGDFSLLASPPPGDSSTSVSALLSGIVTVTEDASGPIAPVVIPFTGTFVPMSTFSLPTNAGNGVWSKRDDRCCLGCPQCQGRVA